MKIAENKILNKLDEYSEKANKYRFILPVDKNLLI